MNTFKTKAGTELPLLNLKGKDYLQVMHRVQWFREEMPQGRIETLLRINDEHYCLFEATIYDQDGRTLANAHGREDYKHFQDAMEKAETKAIGRALGFC